MASEYSGLGSILWPGQGYSMARARGILWPGLFYGYSMARARVFYGQG